MPTNANDNNANTNNGNNTSSSNEVNTANSNKPQHYIDKRKEELYGLEYVEAASKGHSEKTRSFNLSKKYSIGNLSNNNTKDTKKADLSVEGPFHPLYDLRNFNNFRSTKEQFITDDMNFKLNSFKRTAALMDNIMLALHHHVLILCQIMIFYSQKI
jgi:hypothetical protein